MKKVLEKLAVCHWYQKIFQFWSVWPKVLSFHLNTAPAAPIALTTVEIRRKGWLKFGLTEIDWPTFHTAWLIKTETFVSVVCKLQSGSNFGQLIKKSFRWTGSEPQQGRTGSKGERITLEVLNLWNCHYCFAKKPSFLRIFLVSLWKRFSKDNVRLCMLFFRDNYGGNSHFSEKTLL